MFLLLDIGGTNTRIATGSNGRMMDKKTIQTEGDFLASYLRIAEISKKLLGGMAPDRIVCGIAGLLDKGRSELISSPNLPDWVGVPLREKLQEALGAPVILHNDAALGALGEAVYGAGKNDAIVAYITVGTGVGGARIVNKTIDEASLGFEPGRQIINESSGQTLEDLIGGRALSLRVGKHPSQITDRAIWDDAAHHLATALMNISALWSPDVFVLGGSMVRKSPGIKIDDVKRYLTDLKDFPNISVIEASLGDECGLWGALRIAEVV